MTFLSASLAFGFRDICWAFVYGGALWMIWFGQYHVVDLAAAIVAIIFILSESADRFLSSELGDGIGLLAAALVVFFLAPLQRFAERVAAVAMPNTQNTPEYAAFRKMQVYEAAVTEAKQEGGISQKERALLVRLRESLGISETDAEAIETDSQA